MNKPMASNISTSLIISTYNRSDALELCVKSVLRQSLLPDEIIIADEPTGNVDPEMSHEIIELLNEINATGTTVIVVTHEHDLVREFDRRVVVLDHGKIKSDTKDLFVKDDYTDDYGDDSGEEKNTPDYPDNAVVVPE